MSQKQDGTTSQQLTLFAAASRVRTYQLPDAARDWLESDQDYGTSSLALLESLRHDGLLSRTSPACYPATEGEILPSSFAGWSNAGMACAGGFLTLSMPEWHSGAVVCSLSDTLETPEDWLARHPNATREEWDEYIRKHSLSVKARRGILRRAEKRGKGLPEMLRQALVSTSGQAEGATT